MPRLVCTTGLPRLRDIPPHTASSSVSVNSIGVMISSFICAEKVGNLCLKSILRLMQYLTCIIVNGACQCVIVREEPRDRSGPQGLPCVFPAGGGTSLPSSL